MLTLTLNAILFIINHKPSSFRVGIVLSSEPWFCITWVFHRELFNKDFSHKYYSQHHYMGSLIWEYDLCSTVYETVTIKADISLFVWSGRDPHYTYMLPTYIQN